MKILNIVFLTDYIQEIKIIYLKKELKEKCPKIAYFCFVTNYHNKNKKS